MKGRASGLDWDAGNIAKCQKHGVTIEEIEALFGGTPGLSPDATHSVTEQRFIAVGRTGSGRAVFVAFTYRERDGQRYVRPVSARYMHAKEATSYGHEESTGDAD